MFDHEPRNWKWMVPAGAIAPCIYWWNAWFMAGGKWAMLAIIPMGIAGVLLVAAGVNLWAFIAVRIGDINAGMKAAESQTAEVRMFEAARGMHPEAVKALLVHRRTIWRVKYIPLKDTVDWVLDEAPSVHAGFVDFVLDHSNGTLMPKRLLVEGSTKFDPDGLVSDYEQYDGLLYLMQAKLMCTQAFGNQSPHFLPPWNVELLRRRFGLDGEGYQVDEGMSEAMKRVVSSQQAAGSEERRTSNVEGQVPDVIAKALEGLEQTQEMKATLARL